MHGAVRQRRPAEQDAQLAAERLQLPKAVAEAEPRDALERAVPVQQKSELVRQPAAEGAAVAQAAV